MVWHAIDGNGLLLFVADDACHVLVNFRFIIRCNEVLTAFYGKYNLQVNLGIGTWHKKKLGE